jgi:hypothetical protein
VLAGLVELVAVVNSLSKTGRIGEPVHEFYTG